MFIKHFTFYSKMWLEVLESVLMLAITVLAFVMYAKRHNYCEPEPDDGLSVSGWLLGVGLAMLVPIAVALVLLFVAFLSRHNASVLKILVVMFLVVVVLTQLFWIAWLVVGGVTLFRPSSLDCIKNGDAMLISALVIWALLTALIITQATLFVLSIKRGSPYRMKVLNAESYFSSF